MRGQRADMTQLAVMTSTQGLVGMVGMAPGPWPHGMQQ
eukprot:CAMPEP_0202874504 /NCGR_PEP_ID=MMETSP1391-20130828/25530_1 /ASSEMBLY_ACC=CAM_ASM_000867 /TAXON_ID=1034604 /ORGANISM="Chlamydomonas leiostraca, Strain SAG 11-49" /LENGTH=37 /DNA_ID= /DNA_START= /DNA_END= /DNA_ORIENTATION=